MESSSWSLEELFYAFQVIFYVALMVIILLTYAVVTVMRLLFFKKTN